MYFSFGLTLIIQFDLSIHIGHWQSTQLKTFNWWKHVKGTKVVINWLTEISVFRSYFFEHELKKHIVIWLTS